MGLGVLAAGNPWGNGSLGETEGGGDGGSGVQSSRDKRCEVAYLISLPISLIGVNIRDCELTLVLFVLYILLNGKLKVHFRANSRCFRLQERKFGLHCR